MSYHETRFKYDKRRTIVWQEITREIGRRLHIGDTVLDVGCGYGDFINNIRCVNKFAIDRNSGMKQYLNNDVVFVNCEVQDIRSCFDPERFDFIFCSNLLEHLERKEITCLLSTFRVLLKLGGYLAIMSPNYRRASNLYFDDYTHVTPLSDVGLSDWLVSEGFRLVSSDPGFLPYSLKGARLPITPFLVRCWFNAPLKPWGKQMLIVARRS